MGILREGDRGVRLGSVPARELRECLRQADQGLSWERVTFLCKAIPQALESVLVPGQAADIGVSEGALIEAALPGWDGGHGYAVGTAHRAGADAPVIREVPEGGHCQLRCSACHLFREARGS